MKRTFLALLCVALFGCNAGKDDTKAKLSISTTSFSFSATSYETTFIQIPFTLTQADGSTIYIGIEEQNPAASIISSVNSYLISGDSGETSILFRPGYAIGDGIKNISMKFNACYDEFCRSHVSGSPILLNFNTSVTLMEKITNTHPDKIELLSDINRSNKPFHINDLASLTTTGNRKWIYYKINQQHPYLARVSTTQTNNIIDLGLETSNRNNMPAGIHPGYFTLDACYDKDCLYPFKGSPISYQVDINNDLYLPEGSSILITEEISKYTHNVIEAEYIDNSDLLVIRSDMPENAIYIYDIDNSSQKMTLSLPATSLSVDNTSDTPTIAVGYENLVTVINYNKLIPNDSEIITIPAENSVFDLTIKGNYIWISPDVIQRGDAGYGGTGIETIEISSKTSTNSDPYIYVNSIIKVHPSRPSLYTIATTITSPQLDKADLTEPLQPREVVDGPYRDRDNIGINFWFSNNGDMIFTKTDVANNYSDYHYANIFNATEDVNTDMVFLSSLPLLKATDSARTTYFDIRYIEASNDDSKLVVIDGVASGSLRYFDTADMQQTNLFTLKNKTIDDVEYANSPLYAFFSRDEQLYIISASDVNGTNQYSLLKVK